MIAFIFLVNMHSALGEQDAYQPNSGTIGSSSIDWQYESTKLYEQTKAWEVDIGKAFILWDWKQNADFCYEFHHAPNYILLSSEHMYSEPLKEDVEYQMAIDAAKKSMISNFTELIIILQCQVINNLVKVEFGILHGLKYLTQWSMTKSLQKQMHTWMGKQESF